MNKLAALSGIAALGLVAHSTAHGYSATADVVFTFGDEDTKGWTSSGANTLDVMSNDTYFTDPGVTGSNSRGFTNSTFAAASDYAAGVLDDCLTPLPGYEQIQLRKYGCRVNDTEFSTSPYSPVFHEAPLEDNVTGKGPGAQATGTVTVTDTSLTGTLTIVATSDVPTGATTTIVQGARISNNAGKGFDGYNFRTADGSPFGNVWYGINSGATLVLNLTGTFTSTSWEIEGGTAEFTDPGFACQQGGFGGDARGTLCTASTSGGGFQNDGGHLDWGMDKDGSATGFNAPSQITVRDVAGGSVVETLSGARAELTVAPNGSITTTKGEIRRALGSATNGCVDHVAWDGSKMLCGSITVQDLDISGDVQTGPEPIVGTGGNDVLNGTAGNDVIQGLAGNDTINGLGGSDTMEGGPGNDIIFVNVNTDDVVELANQGTDTVRSSATYTLPGNVEHLTLLGTGNLNGTGNALANTLTGNSGNNQLDGKGGADTLKGLAGNDTYIINHAGDVVIETTNQGVDHARATVTHALANNVERLTLLGGSAAINGTGNKIKNVIVGNSGNNTINGWLKADTLTGGGGQDRFLFNSTLSSTNVDTITDFSVVNDSIRLENSVFIGLSPGTLPAAAFRIGNQATTAAHRIIYVSGIGALFFDRDGNGATYNQVRFATVTPGLALTNADFIVQ
jgi:Ca2+-binding RTX toxin-like protein